MGRRDQRLKFFRLSVPVSELLFHLSGIYRSGLLLGTFVQKTSFMLHEVFKLVSQEKLSILELYGVTWRFAISIRSCLPLAANVTDKDLVSQLPETISLTGIRIDQCLLNKFQLCIYFSMRIFVSGSTIWTAPLLFERRKGL